MFAGRVPQPEWLHRELVLPVGEGKYRFRTLSLYDVYTLWPTFAAMARSLEARRPIQLSQEVEKALEHLCPGLTATEDFKAWGQIHLDGLVEFYQKQDWARIKTLGEKTHPDDASPKEATREQLKGAERNFYLLCAAGARMAGMSIIEFVQQRFEFCADALIAMRDRLEEERRESGVMDGDQFFGLMQGMLPTQKLTEEQKPAFIREIEEKSNRVQ